MNSPLTYTKLEAYLGEVVTVFTLRHGLLGEDLPEVENDPCTAMVTPFSIWSIPTIESRLWFEVVKPRIQQILTDDCGQWHRMRVDVRRVVDAKEGAAVMICQPGEEISIFVVGLPKVTAKALWGASWHHNRQRSEITSYSPFPLAKGDPK